MNKIHVKKNDTVVIISGNDKGQKGKILEVSPKEHKVIIEGRNIRTKHVKPKKQGDPGGIMKVEGAIYADKVQLYCPKCDKGVRTKNVVEYKTVDGKNQRTVTRVCAKCGKEI